ncbi:homeobox domain-containing protein 8 [Vairimorpha necatrix]|uniref:Homeobox domain-containing protein 8 n=1 Tax=Vairimorpha necatrix TaxID=6039 RepID=A0AAX4J955_9MICR
MTCVLKNKLTHENKEYLEKYFEINPNPSEQQKAKLALTFDVSICKIKNWFQNKRAKSRHNLPYDECVYEEKVYPTCNSLYMRYYF